jgi:cytochrome c peroxidase
MRRRPIRTWTQIAAVALTLLAPGSVAGTDEEGAETPEQKAEGAAVSADDAAAAALAERAAGLFGVLPKEAPNPANPVTEAKVALGRMLYLDARLSKNHDVSCNSCHQLDNFGVDGEPTSPGHRGQRGDRNSPTVLNAALHLAQFWDGRAADVEEQAKGPILNPIEMAMPDEAAVETTLRSISGYALSFGPAFPDEAEPVTFDNAALAIAAFERRLLTPGPFDAFQAGDVSALRRRQRRGLSRFIDTGCTACHMGPLLGGSSFQKLGAVHPYPTEDVGRFAVTNLETDRYVFKVPSLRNVAKTAPYFHDGSVKTLPEAVRLMAHHQLGRELDEAAVADIAIFLESLTGRIGQRLSSQPQLPPSGPDTPPPDPS